MKTADIADKSRKVKEQAQKWGETAQEQAQEAGEMAQEYVHENTWRSLAIAAGLGCILGFVVAKMTD